MNILPHFKKIRTFVFDLDGVLTDGSLLILNDGQMVRKMNIKDGYALQLAIKNNYNVAIISGGDSESIKTRLEKLGISDVYMKVNNKQNVLSKYAEERNLDMNEILFMGDDIPDFTCMKIVGLKCCPTDSVSEIKNISNYISPYKGGEGCVRDVIEKVLKLNKHWNMDEEPLTV